MRTSSQTAVDHGWWDAYREFVPESYLDLIRAEADAIRAKTFNPLFIPGLLQTKAYATAITVATTLKDVSMAAYDALVEVRMRRKSEQLDSLRPYHLLALLDETVLYRPVGTAATMRAQLDHLLAMTDHSKVTLLVIPRLAGPHPGQLGTYMLVEYDDRDALLFFEGATGNVPVRDRPDLVAAYQDLSGRLRVMGQSVELARTLISSARANLDRP